MPLWLAILATHLPDSELQNGLGTGKGIQGTFVRNVFVRTWNYPGGGSGNGPENSLCTNLAVLAHVAKASGWLLARSARR